LTLTVGSLFAGIGGFDLGLERAGMQVKWQVDNEPFAQHILNKHWPDVPCYSDIRDVRGEEVEPVDILCGGFPCQDISSAGKKVGIDGARSGLWTEYARLVGELRPRYVIVENVAALRKRGLDRVVGDLAALGYDAEWDCIRAADVGAPHRRDRLWLVAYPNRDGEPPHAQHEETRRLSDAAGRGLSDASGESVRQQPRRRGGESRSSEALTGLDGKAASLADAQGVGQRESTTQTDTVAAGWEARRVFGSGSERATPAQWGAAAWWAVEPDVGRVADGIPARVDRLKGLGNALVPQIAQWIGERIVAYEGLRPDDQPEVRLT
jgi:DNA (cytosine-5)-methyltransferase 1